MPLLLVLAFIVVPLLELAVILRVGDAIGVFPTIVILLGVSVGGAWLLKREGRGAWRRFRAALGSGRMPAAEVVDGALVLVGGTLLVTPGFITDAVGLALIAPPSRALVNRAVRARFRWALGRGLLGGGLLGAATSDRRRPRVVRPPADRSADPVDVEVVKIERNRRGEAAGE